MITATPSPSAVLLFYSANAGGYLWLKQIIYTKHNRVKNHNWLEANQLAFRGFQLGTTVKEGHYENYWVTSNQCLYPR